MTIYLSLLVIAAPSLISDYAVAKRQSAVNGHIYEVYVISGPVSKAKSFTLNSEGYVLLEGKRPWGLVDVLPSRDTPEISEVFVTVDGQVLRFPTLLIKDLFNPNLGSRYLGLQAPKTGPGAMLYMLGGDGYGAYHVWWRIQPTGKITRFVAPAG
jgi:hypothetical protein